MENEEKLRKRNLITYPLGTMGRDAVYALINSYLLTFVLFTHSLTAAQLTAITGIMIGSWAISSSAPEVNMVSSSHGFWQAFYRPRWLFI